MTPPLEAYERVVERLAELDKERARLEEQKCSACGHEWHQHYKRVVRTRDSKRFSGCWYGRCPCAGFTE